jgi:hypothetical protein
MILPVSRAAPEMVRPEGRNLDAVFFSCSSVALIGFVILLSGSIIMSCSKKWGWEGDKIHNLALYQKGYITTMVGLGVLLPGLCLATSARGNS